MSLDIGLDKILIIDFGSQFTQLIARRIRESGVFSEIISHKKIKVKDLREIDEPFVVDIIRDSIRKQSIAMPSKKVIEEIIKTFIQSNPGPKSLVSWTRADKDQAGGEICYKDGCIIISKK